MVGYSLKRRYTNRPRWPAMSSCNMLQLKPNFNQQRRMIRDALTGRIIQTKLSIGQPNDKYEQEADRVADKVMRISDDDVQSMERSEEEKVRTKPVAETLTPLVHRETRPEERGGVQKQPEEEKEDITQTKREVSPSTTSPTNVDTGINALKGRGRTLSRSTRSFFEPRFGINFSGVRIHTDPYANNLARSINAKAFTVGNNIVFGSGHHSPGTFGGKRLLAHELTHVTQKSGVAVKRFINLANTKNLPAALYGAADVNKFYKKIAGNHTNLEGLIAGKGKVYAGIGKRKGRSAKKYRIKLVKDILKGLLNSTTIFYYANELEVFDDVYKRAVTSLYMRVSQGTRKTPKVRYPGSVGAKTNVKASTYWTVTTSGGLYKFDLKPAGLINAYEALRTILFEATSKTDTTRMHCDYVIAAIHFMSMAEDMEIAKFNDEVKNGRIKVWLKAPKSFDPTVPASMAGVGSYSTTTVYDPKKKSVGWVKISGEKEIIVGDHLMFYNHSAYNAMNKNQGESWRLENAFVTDKEASGGNFRFQGHGYYSPKSRSRFIRAMRNKFNTLYSRAKALITSGKTAELSTKFPFVKLKAGIASSRKTNKHEIVYSKSGVENNAWTHWSHIPSSDRLRMTLRKVKSTDYPNPFANWGKDKESKPKGAAPFWVVRPMEGFKD